MGLPGMFRAMRHLRERMTGRIPNLALAGDYMGVPSVNGAASSGEAAAEGIVRHLNGW